MNVKDIVIEPFDRDAQLRLARQAKALAGSGRGRLHAERKAIRDMVLAEVERRSAIERLRSVCKAAHWTNTLTDEQLLSLVRPMVPKELSVTEDASMQMEDMLRKLAGGDVDELLADDDDEETGGGDGVDAGKDAVSSVHRTHVDDQGEESADGDVQPEPLPEDN